MLCEIQVKFASENCCKITQYSTNDKIKNDAGENPLQRLFVCLWTSQGLNLGPPDYESVALTN